MTQDDLGWLETKSNDSNDLEWLRIPLDIVWMFSYDFKWVKSTVVAPFWGPSDLELSIYSGSVTSQRETTTLCGELIWTNVVDVAIAAGSFKTLVKLLSGSVNSRNSLIPNSSRLITLPLLTTILIEIATNAKKGTM